MQQLPFDSRAVYCSKARTTLSIKAPILANDQFWEFAFKADINRKTRRYSKPACY